MTHGIKALRRIQMGPETTPKTPVEATHIWRGMGVLADTRGIEHVAEEIGIALPTTRAYNPVQGSAIAFEAIEATFTQLPHIFESAIRQVQTGVADGTGSGKIYEYPFPGPTIVYPRQVTLEGGNNQEVEQAAGCFIESFKISGKAQEGVKVEASWIGGNPVRLDGGFSSPATYPELLPSDHILFGGSRLYIDDDDGDFGDTRVLSTLLEFELDCKPGWVAKYTNESLDFDFIYFSKDAFEMTLKVTYEHNDTALAETEAYQGVVTRLVRLQFRGPALTTADDYTHRIFEMDLPGIYTEAPIGEVDGNDTRVAVMKIGYDPISGFVPVLRVVNESATVY